MRTRRARAQRQSPPPERSPERSPNRSPRRSPNRSRAKTGLVVGLVAGCATLVGCSSAAAPSASTSAGASSSTGNSLEVLSLHNSLPASVKSSGAVSDYINIPYAPMEMYNSQNQPVGVDISLMNDMAQVLGVKVNFTNVEFPELFTALQSGRAQMVMSGISDNTSQRDIYTFIDYFQTGSQMETSRADMEKYHIKGMQSMCGLTVETGEGDAFPPQIRLLSQKYCGSTTSIKQLDVLSLAQSQVNIQDGRAQAMLRAGPESVSYNVHNQPGGVTSGQWVAVGPVYYPTDFGIAFPKGSGLVTPFLNALKVLFKDGKYQQVLAQFNVASDALKVPTINASPQVPS